MPVTQDEIREWARAFHASLVCGTVKALAKHFAESVEAVSNVHLKHALDRVTAALEKGYSLSGALAEHPDVFDKNFITIVRYGEIYGEIDLTLQRFVEHPEDMAPRCRWSAPA